MAFPLPSEIGGRQEGRGHCLPAQWLHVLGSDAASQKAASLLMWAELALAILQVQGAQARVQGANGAPAQWLPNRAHGSCHPAPYPKYAPALKEGIVICDSNLKRN